MAYQFGAHSTPELTARRESELRDDGADVEDRDARGAQAREDWFSQREQNHAWFQVSSSLEMAVLLYHIPYDSASRTFRRSPTTTAGRQDAGATTAFRHSVLLSQL